MIELLRSNNPVLMSYLQAILAERGIAAVLLDLHTSVLEGSIGAIPRRLMVAEEDFATARSLMEDALAAAENGLLRD